MYCSLNSLNIEWGRCLEELHSVYLSLGAHYVVALCIVGSLPWLEMAGLRVGVLEFHTCAHVHAHAGVCVALAVWNGGACSA